LKEVSSPAGKLYNWNILTKQLSNLEIEVDRDIKSLIIAGDLEMINEVLKQIYKRYGPKQSLKDPEKNKFNTPKIQRKSK